MKRKFAFLLIACALLLTACTRDTVTQSTASPTVDVTSTPDMQTSMPDTTGDMATGQPDDTAAAQTLQDGTYAAEMSDAYVASTGNGWQDYLKITVSGGQISEVEFDSLKDGQKKSEVSAEEYPMNPPPSEWIPQLNDAIRAAEMPEAMDTISGATMSSNNARRMYEALLNSARSGNTDIVVLDE